MQLLTRQKKTFMHAASMSL